MRTAIVVAGFVLVLAAAGGLLLGAAWVSLLTPLLFGVLLVVGTVMERRFYKPLAEGAPGAGWRLTEEWFVDPDTGALLAVYYHDRTGERRYVRLPVRPGS
jgi:hypothetical protein